MIWGVTSAHLQHLLARVTSAQILITLTDAPIASNNLSFLAGNLLMLIFIYYLLLS